MRRGRGSRYDATSFAHPDPTPGLDLNGTVMLLLAHGREFGTLTEKTAGLRVALYVEALSDMPTWAVKRARLIFA